MIPGLRQSNHISNEQLLLAYVTPACEAIKLNNASMIYDLKQIYHFKKCTAGSWKNYLVYGYKFSLMKQV